MQKIIYEKGYKFPGTRLTYILESEQIVSGIRRAIFDCECGNYFISEIRRAVNGTLKSCGCYRRENTTRLKTKHGHVFKGKMSGSYRAWCSMNQRAGKKEHYFDVQICERWKGDNGFLNFYEDMGDRPDDKPTLERIFNTKGYSKENCKWASQAEQTRNTSRNVFITLQNKTMVMSEWARFFELNIGLVADRIKRLGWSYRDAFLTPSILGVSLKPDKTLFSKEIQEIFDKRKEKFGHWFEQIF